MTVNLANTSGNRKQVAELSLSAQVFDHLDPKTVADIVGASADIAIIVEDGIIKDVAFGQNALANTGYLDSWPGMAWADTVTVESREKIADLLDKSKSGNTWRQVNHPSQSALDVPIKYTTVPLGENNRFIALGRDLSNLAALQQRLIEAHQDLERDYSRMRLAEARYKLLFNSSPEAILIVDPSRSSIEDVNQAAERMTNLNAERLAKTDFSTLFHSSEQASVTDFLSAAMSGEQSKLKDIALKSGDRIDLSASIFQEESRTSLIVRLRSGLQGKEGTTDRDILAGLLDDLPDALVLADADQRILFANETFIKLSQLSSAQAVRGKRLQTFLGRSSTDLNVLFSALKKYGVVRNFATIFHDRFGDEDKVEVSAVSAPSFDEVIYAFSIRRVSRRIAQTARLGEQLPSSTTDFTELVGRIPLKDIVKESTVLIERLCIEAALEISGNNRASAAEMLGLSRQGLYSKLKRGGIE